MKPAAAPCWRYEDGVMAQFLVGFSKIHFMAREGNKDRDRKLVAGEQEHEVRYESEKTGESAEKVKNTIKSVGNSRDKVEERLDNKRKN